MLPKINHTLYTFEVPSLKKKFKFRPFLVKEEKILLMAKESGDTSDILSAVRQIVNNCAVDEAFDVDKLAIFDLEYLFLKLRSVSIDNVVKVAYRDDEDQSVHEFEIDLNDVNVSEDKNKDNTVAITKQAGLVLRYPPASIYDDKEFMNAQEEQMFSLIIRCIEAVYDGDTLFETKDVPKEELIEFLENLDTKSYERVQEYLLQAPKVEYKIQYVNKAGNPKEIILNSLNDFFIWR
jgi:hypothetical protein